MSKKYIHKKQKPTQLNIKLSPTFSRYLSQISSEFHESRQTFIKNRIIHINPPKVIFSTNRQYINIRSNLEKIGEQLDELNKNIEDAAKSVKTFLTLGISNPKTRARNIKAYGYYFTDIAKIAKILKSTAKIHIKIAHQIDNMMGYDSNYKIKKAGKYPSQKH